MEDLGFQSLAYVISATDNLGEGFQGQRIAALPLIEQCHNSQFTIFRRCMIGSLIHLWLSYHSPARQLLLAEARKHTRDTIPRTSSRSGDSVIPRRCTSIPPPLRTPRRDSSFPTHKHNPCGLCFSRNQINNLGAISARPALPPRIKPVMHRRSRVGACTAAR